MLAKDSMNPSGCPGGSLVARAAVPAPTHRRQGVGGGYSIDIFLNLGFIFNLVTHLHSTVGETGCSLVMHEDVDALAIRGHTLDGKQHRFFVPRIDS